MSDEQMAELYENLVAAKFKTARPAYEYPFQRGFNAGIDFAIEQLKKTGEENDAISDT